MGNTFRSFERDQQFLMPPSVQEWLPEGSLARFVTEIVGNLDPTPILATYSPCGKKAYHPEMLLGLIFYGYATGVFSSRKLEAATYDSVAFRYIAGNDHPDHDTIADFRKRFLKELEGLFLQILVMAKEMGCMRLGKASLDGTKVQANASKHKALSWAYANRLEKQIKEEIDKLMEMARKADSEDSGELDVPAELERREDRLRKIREAKEMIKERAALRHEKEMAKRKEKEAPRAKRTRAEEREEASKKEAGPEPRDKDQVNLTDPESRIMKTKDGFDQCCNAQAAVDNESHLIVASHVTEAGNDKEQVNPALEALEKTAREVAEKPDAILADTGYHSAANIDLCEEAGMTPYIAKGRDKHNRHLEKMLEKPPECPENASPVERAHHRLKTTEGRAVYAKRKCTVETVFGAIKEVLGFRRFHLRGKQSAEGEWTLVSMAWNLKRLHRLANAK